METKEEQSIGELKGKFDSHERYSDHKFCDIQNAIESLKKEMPKLLAEQTKIILEEMVRPINEKMNKLETETSFFRLIQRNPRTSIIIHYSTVVLISIIFMAGGEKATKSFINFFL